MYSSGLTPESSHGYVPPLFGARATWRRKPLVSHTLCSCRCERYIPIAATRVNGHILSNFARSANTNEKCSGQRGTWGHFSHGPHFSNIMEVKVKTLSRVWLFATPWTAAYQAPPSIGISRQEYWSGLPCPCPGDLPNPGIEPGSPTL